MQFPMWGDPQAELEIALVLLPIPSLYERRDDCLGQNEQKKIVPV